MQGKYLAVCVPTYKRPLMLEKLIISIANLQVNSNLIEKIDIVIVDNDIDRSAEGTIKLVSERITEPYALHYSCLPEKGLANVRNELLRKALLLDPDYLVFIDDDSFVSARWLNVLVKSVSDNNAVMARGPVIPVFEDHIPDHISTWFIRPNFGNNDLVDNIITNNLIIDARALRNYDIWFDTRFNSTGAEDSWFGLQMLSRGAKCYWASRAVIFETIPCERAKLNWLIKRYFNGANTFTSILRLERKYFSLGRKILVSFFYLIGGTIFSLFLLLPLRKKYWGILKVSEGAGALAALFSIKYHEYR